MLNRYFLPVFLLVESSNYSLFSDMSSTPPDMIEPTLIFLADDDDDDCMLFQEVLDDLDRNTELIISQDGEQLMKTFEEKVPPIPHVLFLDLNMPRKNGFECLKEIKLDKKLINIPIVVLSTAGDSDYIERAFNDGAHYYIRKPGCFEHLKKLIEKVLAQNWTEYSRKFESFLLHA